MTRNMDNYEQIIQTCLERIQTEQESLDSILASYPDYAEALRPELEAAMWLQRGTARFRSRPGFIDTSTRRLVSQIEREQRNGKSPARSSRNGGFRLFGLFAPPLFTWQFASLVVLIIALVTSTSGVALAAQGTLPGDQLYPVKIALEQIELAVTPGAAGSTRLHLTFADQRLVEVQSLVMQGRFQNVTQAAENFERHMASALEGLDRLAEQDRAQAVELAASLEETLSGQLPMISILAEIAPPEWRPNFDRLQMTSQDALSAAHEVLTSPDQAPDGTQAPGSQPRPGTTMQPPENSPAPDGQATPEPPVYLPGDVDPAHTPTPAAGNLQPPSHTSTPGPADTPVPANPPQPAQDAQPTQASPGQDNRPPHTPPGLENKPTHTPPGLDNRPPQTPPGQDNRPTEIPPGQEDKPTKDPPGQEDKPTKVPPGHEDKPTTVPPGQEDKPPKEPKPTKEPKP